MKQKLLKLALCAMALLPLGAWADTTWTFTSWSEATITNLNEDATNWAYTAASSPTTGGYWDYKVTTAATSTGEALSANSTAISELSGLTFFWPAASGGGRIRIDNRSTNKALFFKSHQEKVFISGLTAGKKISINLKGNNNTRITSDNSNVVAYNQAAQNNNTRTDVFIVSSAITSETTVSFHGEANGVSFNMFSITVSDATAEELAMVNFGSDDVVTATTLWTFDQYFANDVIAAQNTLVNYAGLYMKAHNSTGNDNKAGSGARNSTYGSYTVNTANYCNVAGGHAFNASEIKSCKASTGITDAMAINIGTPGKLYIEGSLSAASRRIEVYEGNGLSNLTAEISALKKGTLTATGANADESVLEVTITEPGTYWLAGVYTKDAAETGCAYRIYSIMFVPTTATAMTKTVTLTSAGGGYATFSAPQSYVVPEDVTAYYVSEVSDTKATTTAITAGNVIPACTGVILYKEGVSSDTEITLTSSETYSPITNLMMPNLAAYALAASGTISKKTYYNYTLAAGPTFMHSSGEGTLAAGKAFLRTTTNVAGARSIDINFGDGTTNISESVVEASEGDGKWYTLQGVEVKAPAKGLYIRNGKKVFIK